MRRDFPPSVSYRENPTRIKCSLCIPRIRDRSITHGTCNKTALVGRSVGWARIDVFARDGKLSGKKPVCGTRLQLERVSTPTGLSLPRNYIRPRQFFLFSCGTYCSTVYRACPPSYARDKLELCIVRDLPRSFDRRKLAICPYR